MPEPGSEPIFFATAAELRRWLRKYHRSARELWVGYYKKASGRPGITYPESVDEALCFGWIDGIRKTLDESRYINRFTPRRPGSIWSQVNIRRARELIAAGRMRPAGRRAFDARDPARTKRYSFEQRQAARLSAADERRFRANRRAWEWFATQPPGYRRTAIFWVVSARRDETRGRRLQNLIDDSAAGRRIGPLRRPGQQARIPSRAG